MKPRDLRRCPDTGKTIDWPPPPSRGWKLEACASCGLKADPWDFNWTQFGNPLCYDCSDIFDWDESGIVGVR